MLLTDLCIGFVAQHVRRLVGDTGTVLVDTLSNSTSVGENSEDSTTISANNPDESLRGLADQAGFTVN